MRSRDAGRSSGTYRCQARVRHREESVMKLCMFTPRDLQLERGWPGIVEGDTLVQLAAQTLQAYFTGGRSAPRPAEHALNEVEFPPPALHPPPVRASYAFDPPVKPAPPPPL